jgi:uncharacterized protein YcfL
MQIKMKKLTPFLILLLTAVAGCVTRVERMEPAQPAAPATHAAPPAQSQTVTDKRVVIDPALQHVIHIVRIKSTMGAEGYLKIQLNVQKLTGFPKNCNYRIDWFDADGMSLPLAGTVLPWMLLSHETSFLAATSPTPAARDFRVVFGVN